MPANNAAFHRRLREVPKAIERTAAPKVREQADRLVAAMKQAANAHSKTGKTSSSIRAEPGARATQVIVKAGGPLTTKEVRKGSGVRYDYVRAEEFSTATMTAIPFFWPTYRRLKNSIREVIKESMRQSAKGMKF